jgi:hypothetical protein
VGREKESLKLAAPLAARGHPDHRHRHRHRALEPADVAVVVSHNAQASVVHALLRGRDVDGVTVGTLHGGRWAAAVALDPLTGTDGLSAHAASAGRQCVMASRHYAHLTWVHDGAGRETPSGDGDLGDSADRSKPVRIALTQTGAVAGSVSSSCP